MSKRSRTNAMARAAKQAYAALALLLLCASAAAGPAWPVIAIPAGVSSFAMGGEVMVNGLPVRMRGLLAASPPARVAALFRTSLGHPLVEDTRGHALVLGRALGEFYVTVLLEPAGTHPVPGHSAGEATTTRGVIAVSRLGAALALADGAASRQVGQRLLAQLPAGSRLISRVTSVDGGRRAESLALSSALDVASTAAQMSRTLVAEGYAPERTAASANPGLRATAEGRSGVTTLAFSRPGAETLAVIYRDQGGNTAVVLNTVTDMEHKQ